MNAASKLTPKQLLCSTLLATGHTCRSASKVIGVTPQTVTSWNKLLPFRAAVSERLESTLDEANLALTALRLKAAERLGELADSKQPSIAIRACESILRLQSMTRPYVVDGETDEFGLRAAEEAIERMFRLDSTTH